MVYSYVVILAYIALDDVLIPKDLHICMEYM